MKVIFMGTPAYAAESLKALIADVNHEVLAVCTQPDRPAGRGHKLQESPVKALAREHNIPILQPQTLRLAESKEIRAQLKDYGADIFVVAAYGLILPKGVLEIPPNGCINVHASRLPKYRGASPIHSALLNGDTETGITIMQMDTGIDTGALILQKSLEIRPDERFVELHDRMAALGGEALIDALLQIENGTAIKTPQDNALSSYSPMIKKSDGEINRNDSAEKILNQIRALEAWPGCFMMYNGQPLKIWRAEPADSEDPGRGIFVKTGDGAILITELQAQGKKRMPAADFLRGQKSKKGSDI